MKRSSIESGPRRAGRARLIARLALWITFCVLAASCSRLQCGGQGSGKGSGDPGSTDAGMTDAGMTDGGGRDAGAGACAPTLTPTCGGLRWVAIKKTSGGECPLSAASKAAGWTAAPLVKLKGPLPSELARTCIYTRAAAPTNTDLCTIEDELIPPTGLASLVEECRHVYPMGIQETMAATFRTALHAQAGGVPEHSAEPPRQTRLIAVDTDPDRFEAPETCADSHGCTVAHIAKDLMCPRRAKGACAGPIGWAEALPHTFTDGGRYGYPSELAAAVLRAFDAWRSDLSHSAAAPIHLVLNLSLGWEADAPCDEPGGPRAAVQALRYAACNGVLAVAAAGNAHRADSAPSQMACPARLEAQDITWTACQTEGLVDPVVRERTTGVLGVPYQPIPDAGALLLYAAGGLDYLDRPIVPERPSARPVLAAPALGGASWASPLGSPSPTPAPTPLSGTSVSAALVSGAAAAVWAYSPTKRPDEIIKRLVETAVEARPPGALTGPGAPIPATGRALFQQYTTVRRLSLCSALGVPCPQLLTGATNPALPGAAFTATALPQPISVATAGACTADPANLPGLVVPEPNNPRCPHCAFLLSWGAMNGQPALLGTVTGAATLPNLTLLVQGPTGAVTTFNFDQGARAALGGTSGPAAARLTFPAGAATLPASTRAWLMWEQTGPNGVRVTVGQPLYVIP